jgi:hypothetical protein
MNACFRRMFPDFPGQDPLPTRADIHTLHNRIFALMSETCPSKQERRQRLWEAVPSGLRELSQPGLICGAWIFLSAQVHHDAIGPFRSFDISFHSGFHQGRHNFRSPMLIPAMDARIPLE